MIDHNRQHELPLARRDAALAIAIGAALAAAYALLIQFNYTYDGAFYTKCALQPNDYFLAAHMIFGPWLKLAMTVGGALGIDPRIAGSLQSVLTMAATMALLFIAMRRCGVARAWGALFTILMALNAATLDNATSVELYGFSMAAVMLSLNAFLSESRRPTRGGAWRLIAANVFVVWAHVGFSFWVLGGYVALAIAERRFWRGMQRFAQGFGVLAALYGAMWASTVIGLKVYGAYDYMYAKFYQQQSILSHAVSFVLAPATWFQAFGGLAIFPAVTGWLLERRRMPALALHGALTSVLFFGFYHAWNVDWGTFYMPIMAVWAIFAALGAQAVFRGGDKRVQWALGLLALLIAAFLIRPYQGHRHESFWVYGHPSFALSGVLFYACVVAQWHVAAKLSAGTASRLVRNRAGLAWAAAALAITLFCYLPRQLWLLRPDEFHDYSDEVRNLMRGRDILRERLISSRQSDRIELDTGVKACSYELIGSKPSEGILYDQNPVSEWIRDTVRPSDPLHVWMDAAILPTAQMLWNRGILEDIPVDLLSFRPVTVGKHTFVEIAFKDADEARRYALRLDPYPAEDWGGVPVEWTRPSYEQKVAREGDSLDVKYFVGHKRIGPTHPVRVEIFIDGALVHSSRHEHQGASTAKLRVPETAGKKFTLAIKVKPGYRAREGRDLGVGLYPPRWD